MDTDLNPSHTEVAGHAEAAGAASPADIPSDFDVLVVGYGPVGAAIVNLLGLYGVRTLVIDKDKEIFTAPRAIALDNEALRILQMAGLVDGDFDKVAIPYVRMLSPQLGEFGRINTLGHIDGHPKLVTFYQPELDAALRRRAARYGEVHTALGVALTGFVENSEGLVATLDAGEGRLCTVRARYLIGADGASSLVRQLIGQAFTGKTYAEDWLSLRASSKAMGVPSSPNFRSGGVSRGTFSSCKSYFAASTARSLSPSRFCNSRTTSFCLRNP